MSFETISVIGLGYIGLPTAKDDKKIRQQWILCAVAFHHPYQLHTVSTFFCQKSRK